MDRRISEKARRVDTAAGHRFAHPDFVKRAAKVVSQPLPAHFERLPRLQQSRTARTVRGVELFQEQIGRYFQSSAHLRADRLREFVKAPVRVFRFSENDVLAGVHYIDLPRPHVVVVWVPRLALRFLVQLIERHILRGRLRLYEGSKKGLDHRSHELGLCVAPELEQRLDHLREITHATILIRALRVNDVQHVGESGVFLICQNAGPLRPQRCAELEGVCAADMVGHHHAVLVYLHAVVYGVAVVRVLPGGV
jgi:hypothetical protein